MIELADGQAFTSTLKAHIYQFFSFPVTGKRDISFVVTQMSGDPDLYVSVGEKPDRMNNTWKSEGFGSDAVVITESDENSCGDCTYFLGVYAFTDASFSITASYEAISEIKPGTPAHGQLIGNMEKFYKVYVVNDTTSLSITATI